MDEQIVNGKRVYGRVCIRRQRRKRQKLLISELMMEYTQNSTLHGLRYTTERGRSVVEKLFWSVVFLVSMGWCAYLIRNVYWKWQNSPVIVAFNDYIVPVGNVPFPSVTICPQTKSDAKRFNYTDEFLKYKSYYDKNQFVEETANFSKLEDMMTVCNVFEQVKSNKDITNVSLVNNLLNASLTSSDFLYSCEWRGTDVPCTNVFRRVLTVEGVCYTFNALAAKEIFRENSTQNDYKYLETTVPKKNWTRKNGYKTDDFNVYPRRGRENAATPDLRVLLGETNSSKDIMCNTLKKGYKIFLQHPADLPQATLYYYAALSQQTSSLALKFNMIKTAISLEEYPSAIRKCYFPKDRYLRYFRIYTANNCRLECQSNYTLERCGCVWFHMPHNDSGQICTANKWRCVRDALGEMATKEMNADEKIQADNVCRCYPECHSIYYDAEILKTEFDAKSAIKANGLTNSISNTNLDERLFSTIELYFKEPRFVSMKRSELFGLTDFLANCGGLLGLFLGFSFLSLVEIVYFITLRLYYILMRDLKAEKRNGVVIEKTDNKQEKF